MMNEPSTREVFRQAMDLLAGDGPDSDAVRAAELLGGLSPDQLERLSGVTQMLVVSIELTRKKKIKELAGRN